ncbi:ATP synthase subunit I [Pullulanibacillus sp. KACC 23026]|uniref:ATP synthase subunit I n=1 Tax=Pullulanibacillus sp. KACC 23026 TaxID=3028315 RepID=UPI0023B115E3|nr:ATP synthase subunit I [Pullulanibacillus sp. KACC 23026]WEG13108.1 ATP synthase subunit I [Pullulanibacillus sp. KACC 23026]
MNEYTSSRRLVLILTSFIFLVSILLWYLTPAKSFVAGFILGGLISLYNVLYLGRRIKLISQLIIAGSHRRAGLGFLNRILMVVFGAILVYKFPEWLDYRSYVLGLPLCYILLLIATGVTIKKGKEPSSREGRDVLGTDSEN